MVPESHSSHMVFVGALKGTPPACGTKGCGGPVESVDISPPDHRVKTFELHCVSCGWRSTVTGKESTTPPWDEASLLEMADEHLMHQEPRCPNDGTPVIFTSLPNPRRRARYRISCYYCGRQAQMDWPPPESRR